MGSIIQGIVQLLLSVFGEVTRDSVSYLQLFV